MATSDIIHLLPDTVANQIAAGEVVQRPSSVVKEMLENSIDADATCIQVLVSDGGKANIQIIDNGKGMSETDARLAFERHATSKISEAADLFNLSTMGFRGEALASIVAVAQVELKTRRPQDELGTYIQMSGSNFEKQEYVNCPSGSNFSVKNIFFNVPARRRFLKSSQTELSNIITEFERVALAHPDVEFVLSNNNSEIYKLGSASLRQRILDVFGKKVNSDLLSVEVETSIVKIKGYVAKPEASRKKGLHQFFFVNGRFMKHSYFNSAVMHAYDNLIPPGDHVSYFIYLTVDPSAIDVNVHPTKTEIKFEDEQNIWMVLHAAVKESLGRNSEVPTIEFDVVDKPEIPSIILLDSSNKPFVSQPKGPSSSYNPFDVAKRTNTVHQADLWTGFEDEQKENVYFDSSLPFFQYQGKYIIMPSNNGLLVIDQRRAHIKVLFEEYMGALSEHQGVSQGLLFPEIVQLSKPETRFIDEIMGDLESIGFDISNLGGDSFSINGIPSGLEGVSPSKLLHDLIYSAMEAVSTLKEQVQIAIAQTLARSAALVYGQILSDDEIRKLLEDLFKLPSPKYTSEGQVVFNIIESSILDKNF